MRRSRVRRTTDRPKSVFALQVRASLYQQVKDDFGCECTEEKCPKHLRLAVPEPDPEFFPRIRHLVRIESMVNVGCKFGPNDLTFDVWRDLIALTRERQWMDGKVAEVREAVRKHDAEMRTATAAARQEAGVPAPGQSLFPPAKGRRK